VFANVVRLYRDRYRSLPDCLQQTVADAVHNFLETGHEPLHNDLFNNKLLREYDLTQEYDQGTKIVLIPAIAYVLLFPLQLMRPEVSRQVQRHQSVSFLYLHLSHNNSIDPSKINKYNKLN